MEPVSNYIVALGGNPRYLSALAHLGNLIPSTKDRPSYNQNGEAQRNEVTNLIEKNIVGAPRPYWPRREDIKCLIEDVLDGLQVDSKRECPFKVVRYPQEEGEFTAKMKEQRIKWLLEALKVNSRQDAKDLAMKELANFFNPEALDHQDPLGSLSEVSIIKSYVIVRIISIIIRV